MKIMMMMMMMMMIVLDDNDNNSMVASMLLRTMIKTIIKQCQIVKNKAPHLSKDLN